MNVWPMPLVDFWVLDPLPVPPDVQQDSMTYWRWVSRVTLEARRVR